MIRSRYFRTLLAISSAAACLHGMQNHAAETILFQDNFDVDSSGNWSVFGGSGTGTDDYTVDWAFDYSTTQYTSSGVTTNIPPAPSGDGSTRGVKLTVNNNDEVRDTAAVNLYPVGQTFSGNYAVRFDMWLNYNGGVNGGTGSTESAIFGINHAGDKVNWDSSSVITSDGIFFAVTGEGGSAVDYATFEGDAFGAPLRFTDQSGGFLDRNNDGIFEDEVPSNAELALLFPAPPGETAGAPSKQWVQVELRQRDGLVTWLMNGYVIAQTTSELGWTEGNLMLGLMDVFSSIANPREENYVIYDNLRVVDLSGQPAFPSLALEATIPSAAEPSSPGSFTITRTGDTSVALDVNLRVRGTATAGQDYATIALTTNIPAGAATLEIPVTVLDDPRGEPIETVILDLVNNPAQYEVFAPMTAQVEITDDGDVTTVRVEAVQDRVYEGLASAPGIFRFTRLGDIFSDLQVNFTVAGTAVSGVDYEALPANTFIPAGLDSVELAVMPIENFVPGGGALELTLAPGEGYVIGTSSNAAVTLFDNEREPGEVVFADSFETDTSADWNVNEAHEGLSRVIFNWDYSELGIPPAPHTTNGTTRGLKMQANIGEATFTGVSVSPAEFGIEGDYRLSFDMWINFNGPLPGGGGGSTMSLSAGIGTDGTAAQFPDTGVDGLLFSATGEGGASHDYRVYAGSNTQLDASSGVFAAGTEAGVRNHNDPYYSVFGGVFAPDAQVALYPDQGGETGVGTVGLAWHHAVIEKRGNEVSWSISGVPIATVQLTNEISTNIFVGFYDINGTQTEVEDLSFGLVDNLNVEQLEPSEPVGDIIINSIVHVDGDVVIEFSAPSGMSSFVVEASETVNGNYEPLEDVQIETAVIPGGEVVHRATIEITALNQFFLVRTE